MLTPIRSVAADGGPDGASRGEHDHDEESDSPRSDFAGEHCAEAFDWPQELASAEHALLERINDARDRRIECRGRDFEALEPLRVAPALQCSARLHSRDMVVRDFIGRTNPDGDDPDDRMRAAGFDVDESSESIVVDESDPSQVLQALLEDWDDCMNVATRELGSVGIGHYQDLWTLDFARD